MDQVNIADGFILGICNERGADIKPPRTYRRSTPEREARYRAWLERHAAGRYSQPAKPLVD